jgi:glutaredoxin
MVKSYFKEHNIAFEEKPLSEIDNKVRLFELKPDAKKVPQVFVNGINVGGSRETLEFFDRIGV